MDKKELMAEYNRAVLFGEIYDSKPATQKGQSAVRIGRGKNAGKFFIRGSKGGGAPAAKAKPENNKGPWESGEPSADIPGSHSARYKKAVKKLKEGRGAKPKNDDGLPMEVIWQREAKAKQKVAKPKAKK